MPPTSNNLYDRLRALADYAAAGGAPQQWLDDLMQLLNGLLAKDAVVRRRLAALQDARERAALIERLQARGLTQKAACAQAHVSPRTIQRHRRGDKLVSPIGAALRSWACPPAASSSAIPTTKPR